MVKVHYFYDPMCGWCYGAAPLVEAISETKGMELIYHPGGMISKKSIEQSFRQHILQHDQNIAALTGAQFGDDYKARVTSETEFIFDSYITTRAVLVAEEMGVDPHLMIKTIQIAHYQKGETVDQLETLKKIAISMGLDEAIWNEKMQKSKDKVQLTIEESHQLMAQQHVSGYPTLAIEKDGQWTKLSHTQYYGKTAEWKIYLNGLL
jgi:putative protein-disulfide isomerase